MSEQDLTEIKVAMARVEERQETNLHNTQNISTKLDGLFSKLDKYATLDDLIPIDKRVAEIEKTNSWIVRGFVAGAAMITGGIYAIGKKIGVV